MSFYGSVYYQLIDTFHKIVLTNGGKETSIFAQDENISEEPLTQQAVGRKGVIALDAGNRWINFSQAEKDDPNAPGQKIIFYKIWHGKPNEDAINEQNGFKLLGLSSDEIAKRIVEEGNDDVIILKDADKFESHEAIYDDAGHIVKTERKVYRLPKAEVNEKVEKLETLVGAPEILINDSPVSLGLPEVLENRPENVHTFIEANTSDINLLQNYVGKWSEYNKQPEDYPISKVIGNINTMLGSDYLYSLNFRSFVDIIGLIKEFDTINFNSMATDGTAISGKPANIIDCLIKLKKVADASKAEMDKNKEIAEDANLGLTALIGNPIDARIDIYDHLRTIYGVEDGQILDSLTTLANRTKTIEDNLDWPRDGSTVNEEVIKLQERATDLEDTLNWSSSKKTVSEEIDAINTTLGWSYERSIGGEVAHLHEVNAEINRTIADHFEKATAAQVALIQEDQRIAKAINIESIPAESTVMGEINKINTTIGILPNEYDNINEFIGTVNTNLNNTIGEVPEDYDNVVDFIEITKTNLQSQMDNNETNLQNQINTINANLGTKPEDGSNAFAAIAKNTNDIQALNNKVGISEGQTVAGLVADLSNSVNKNTQDISDIKTTYIKTEDANNTFVPLATFGEWNAESTVAAEISKINTIIGDVPAWEEPDNTIVLKINKLEGDLQTVSSNIGDTSLVENNIIALLLEIKEDIRNMKVTINGLHSENETAPFPEVVEKEPENGGEENGEEPIV